MRVKKNLTVITDQAIVKQKVTEFGRLVTRDQLNELTQHQYSANSLLAFTKDWNIFLEFCISRSVRPIPASATAVRQFLEFEARSRKYSTIKRYAVTISLVHSLLNQKDPTATSQVKTTLTSLRLEKHGDDTQAASFDQHHLDELFELLNDNPATRVIRDLAIYHVMFECALKRSELKKLSFEQLVCLSEDSEDYAIQFGETTYALSSQAKVTLSRWVALLPQQQGVIFRAIDRHGNISAGALNDSSIFRILRNAGEYLQQPELKFSGHSARIGAARQLAKQGYKARDIQEFGRWLSAAMPYQYIGSKNTAEQEKLKFVSFKPLD